MLCIGTSHFNIAYVKMCPFILELRYRGMSLGLSACFTKLLVFCCSWLAALADSSASYFFAPQTQVRLEPLPLARPVASCGLFFSFLGVALNASSGAEFECEDLRRLPVPTLPDPRLLAPPLLPSPGSAPPASPARAGRSPAPRIPAFLPVTVNPAGGLWILLLRLPLDEALHWP